MTLCTAQCFGQSLLGRADAYLAQNTSLFQNLVECNDPPTLNQTSLVNDDILPGISSALTSVTAKLQELRSAMVSLFAEDAALRAAAKHYRGLISPIRLLPLEILAEIIWHASSDDVMSAGAPQWELGRVCRGWRSASLSCHSIWTSVALRPSRFPTYRRGVDHLQMVLDRSGQLPLTIDIRCVPKGPRGDLLRRMVLEQAYRWLNASVLYSPDAKSPSSPEQFPLLRSLSVLVTRDLFGFDNYHPHVLGAVFAPNLAEFEWRGGPLEAEDMPWNQITTLRFQLDGGAFAWDDNTAAMLITACTSVYNFFLSMQSDVFFGPMGGSTTPVLRCGAKSVRADSRDPFLLDRFSFPELESLYLLGSGKVDESDCLVHLKLLFTRSDCAQTLTSFRLHAFCILVDDYPEDVHLAGPLMTLLREAVHLSNLDVDLELRYADTAFLGESDPTRSIIDALENPTFLPCITSMSVRGTILYRANVQETYVPWIGPAFDSLDEYPLQSCRRRMLSRKLVNNLRSRWQPKEGTSVAQLNQFKLDVLVRHRDAHGAEILERMRRGVGCLFLEEEISELKELVHAGMSVGIRFCGLSQVSGDDDDSDSGDTWSAVEDEKIEYFHVGQQLD